MESRLHPRWQLSVKLAEDIQPILNPPNTVHSVLAVLVQRPTRKCAR